MQACVCVCGMGIVENESSKKPVLQSDIKAWGLSRSLQRGRLHYELAVTFGDDSRISTSNSLISMYGKCGHLDHARDVFENMHKHTVVSWNALILGYAAHGEGETALYLFLRMKNEGFAPDARTLLAVLKACECVSRECLIQKGKALHLLAVVNSCGSNVYLETALVDVYARCGSMNDSRSVFERIAKRNVASWNALIFGYVENGQAEMALLLFSRMGLEECDPNERTFLACFQACGGLKSIERGKLLHLLASSTGFDFNVYVRSSLVEMYAKCGRLVDGRRVCESHGKWNVIMWTALMFGYVDNGEGEMALKLFCETDIADPRVFVAALKACSNLALKRKGGKMLETGKVLELLAVINGFHANIYVQNTLVDLFSKCGSMDDAFRAFVGIVYPDIISWNALISGYATNLNSGMALMLFAKMCHQGGVPDGVTFVAVLTAIRVVMDVEVAKVIHLLSSSSGSDSEFHVQALLVELYSKHHLMAEAQRVFESMRNPDLLSWNALMWGYVDDRQGEKVLELFIRMERQGQKADGSSFAAALKGCCLLGTLEAGRKLHGEIRNRGFGDELASSIEEFYVECGTL